MKEMKGVFSKFLLFFKRKGYTIATIIVVALVVGLILKSNGNGKIETVSMQTIDLVRTVKISGKVVPKEKVDLSFEVSGIVSSVDKSVGESVSRGQVLARLGSGSILAEIQKAEADLSSAKAELNKLEGTQVYENSITNAKRTLTQAIVNSYTTATDAVYNKADQLFTNPRGSTPTFIGDTNEYGSLRDSIEKDRVHIGFILDEWKSAVANLSGTSFYSGPQLDLSKKYLNEVTTFTADVFRLTNAFKASNSMTQASVDNYKAVVLTASDNLSTATSNFIDGENSLAKLLSDVPVQVAKVASAEATVLNLRYGLAKTSLLSPIDGVVARQDAKIGETVTLGISLVSVISRENVVEAYVPEVSIAGIKIGNVSRITLDAYGPDAKFEARVEQVDPAETIRDGVSTYKTKLSFLATDERVRSGMTANIEIETFRKPGVAVIPDRTVLRESEATFVYLLEGEKGMRKVSVSLGESDSKGNVEVLSGLAPNDLIVVNPKEN